MNVLIITKDEVFSRMLFLEISAFGAQAHEARELSEETKREIPLCDFTVLDAELFAAETEELAELEKTQVLLFGYPEVLESVSSKIAAGFRVFPRPFLVTSFLSSFFEKSDEAEFGLRPAKRRKSAADSLILNETAHTVSYKRQTAELTGREFALLLHLVKHKGETVTRASAAQAVWGKDGGTDTNIVDVYIRYLREKLDEKFGIKIISTVRGEGYTIKNNEY
jgi:DNA-binding winged helix-turn-helix (wHTH) protein